MQISSITVEPVRVSVAVAELIVRIALDGPAAGAELRGTLVGPKCSGISTIEVSYPLRNVAAGSEAELLFRVVVPEPNFWSPIAPFRYEGRVEVWRDAVRIDSCPFAVELRPAG